MAKFYKSELTVSCESTNKNKNYLGILMSILVLMLISSMIVAAIVIISPDIVSLSARAYTTREAITLEETMLGELSPNDFDAQWFSSEENSGGDLQSTFDELLFEDSKNINTVRMPKWAHSNGQAEFVPNVITLVANTSLLASIDYQGFKISPSKRYLLIWTNRRKQFRHSFTAKYFLYDIKLDLISMLSTSNQMDATNTNPNPNYPANSSISSTYESLDSAAQYLNDHDDGSEFTRFQKAEWFKSANSHDSLILVQNNNIFWLADVSANENQPQQVSVANNPIKLTRSGELNSIYNGVPDWLYEEEILADEQAFKVSPKSTTLAYMSFNDSQVDIKSFPIYGPIEQVLPKTQHIRYPKTGRVNPHVSVHLIELNEHSSLDSRLIELPDDLSERQHYIYRIEWLTDDKLSLIWLNRNQNESYFVICSREANWKCDKNLRQAVSGGWLDVSDNLISLSEDSYLTLMHKNEGEQVGSFKHLAQISLKQVDTYNWLTGGRFEVLNIVGIDKRKQLVYFTATPINEPGQSQVYSVGYSKQVANGARGSNETHQEAPLCLTCDHRPEECLHNSAKFSPSTDYYLFHCDGPGIPRTELRFTPPISGSTKQVEAKRSAATNDSTRTNWHQRTNLLWTIETNQALKDKLTNSKAMPITVRLTVPIPDTNYTAKVLMLLPPQLGSSTTAYRAGPGSDPQLAPAGGRARPRRAALQSGNVEQALHSHYTADSIHEYASQLTPGQQYPMVVDVYGGPESQKVDYRFHLGFGHYLASSRRTIYAMIDGRGSGNEGTKRMFELYHRLGTVEIEDQIEVAAQLARQYSFIDPAKLAIWGWSYGGYAAAMALAQSNARVQVSAGADSARRQAAAAASTNSTFSPLPPPPTFRLGANGRIIEPAGVFECAASVAPVTNWIYYDTAYTERYMSSPYWNERYDHHQTGDHRPSASGLPSSSPFSAAAMEAEANKTATLSNKWRPLNETLSSLISEPLVELLRESRRSIKTSSLGLNERYMRAALTNQIDNVGRKRFLLIHGTADDNVHFQQSIMLMKRLIQKNILFETRLYPDQDHGIANKADKLHLGATLSDFFAECFDMASI